MAAKITAHVKAKAVEDIFKPAPAIVDEPEFIARQANRLRQRLRPKEPVDLDFRLEEEHLPEAFLKSDLTVNGRRHLVFATDEQLDYLSRAKDVVHRRNI
ncbi:hypothetical protein OS493_027015 [Desmophyllum pertusum]|uniref:Uncharacterized protein n=1 Tax=Desmophyllum pertusum TaxID=174260 RepID=A0A9W9YKS0_9CNID|nr:hypothetical protein OS493_027015 [Desmophyllum pertusum]